MIEEDTPTPLDIDYDTSPVSALSPPPREHPKPKCTIHSVTMNQTTRPYISRSNTLGPPFV